MRVAKTLMQLFFSFVLCLPAGIASAAADAKVWERWTEYDAASIASMDHSAWQEFLDNNLKISKDGVNRIAYAVVSPADRELLDHYIITLSGESVSKRRRSEQLAYWINFYNALTVKVVLDNYPVPSILKISSGVFSVGPWSKKRVEVEGEPLSLDDMEHRILRPIWKDPRIHYAVNCASIGCPNLRPTAYSPSELDATLTLAAREYINSQRGVKTDNGKLLVSSIYEWFADDFGGTDEHVIAHLKQYADAALANQLSTFTAISDDFYDWGLNEPL
jgi:hypothetical protein